MTSGSPKRRRVVRRGSRVVSDSSRSSSRSSSRRNARPNASSSQGLAINTKTCKANCPELVSPWGVKDWGQFFNEIGTWLIPWLALLSQLPYGAALNSDNVMSMLLALGSPVLALYSLVFTGLNRRYLARTLSNINYPNIDRAYTILDKLQQAPLRVDEGGVRPRRLNVFPEDDELWNALKDRGLDAHTWNAISAFGMAWVVIAYGMLLLILHASHNPLYLRLDNWRYICRRQQ